MLMPNHVLETESPPEAAPVLDAHVVILSAFIPLHRVPVWEAFQRRVRKLTVLLSTPMEADRNWRPNFGDLNVEVLRTTTLKLPRRHPLGFRDYSYVHFSWDIVQQLWRLKPDVVFSTELGFRAFCSTVYARLFRRTPLLYGLGLSEHTEQGKGWLRHCLRKCLLPRPDSVVVNGPSGANYLAGMGVPRDRIHRVRYSAPPNHFRQVPWERTPQQAHELLYVGRLVNVKGLLPFLEALARWAQRHPERDIRWTLVGEGPEKSSLENAPRPANLTLRFQPHCEYAALAQHYAEAGIFVMPSLSDDWGIVVNEAMESSLPILGSVYSQGVYELCEDGVTGWRYRPDVPAEVDNAVEMALATSPEQLAQMRQNVRDRIAPFTPENGAADLAAAVAKSMERFRSKR